MCRITCLVLTILLAVNHTVAWKYFWRGKWIERKIERPDNSDFPPDQWFEQKLDHFDVINSKTWEQVFDESMFHYLLKNMTFSVLEIPH